MVGASRVKICFLSDSPYAGGAERYLSLLATGLDARRFETSLVASDNPGLDGWCDELSSAGIPVVRVPMRLPFRPFDALPIWRAIDRLSPHVAHINMPGPYNGQMGLLAPLARFAGVGTIVVTEHLPMVERLWKRALVKSIAYRCVNRVLTICNANVPFLIERQGVPSNRIDVVYNGVPDAQQDSDGTGESAVNLAFVGSLIERKGLGCLLDALHAVEEPEWKLRVAGSGEDEAAFRKHAAESRIGERVRFLGQIGGSEVAALFSKTDVLVVPSFMEGMPYVILEAMAHSVPVVASRINGIPEAVAEGESGLLVEPGDVAALRAAILRVMTDEALRSDMGTAARDRFDRLFRLERHIEIMQRFYLDVSGTR